MKEKHVSKVEKERKTLFYCTPTNLMRLFQKVNLQNKMLRITVFLDL
jgi:hypothetical protein